MVRRREVDLRALDGGETEELLILLLDDDEDDDGINLALAPKSVHS